MMLITKCHMLLRCLVGEGVLRHTVDIARLTPVAQSRSGKNCHKICHRRQSAVSQPLVGHRHCPRANQFRRLPWITTPQQFGSCRHQLSTEADESVPVVRDVEVREGDEPKKDLIEGETGPSSDVEEFGVDILAEMDDPPVLDDFAYLPLPSHTYTLSSYVEHSEMLQKLVQMGVDLSKVERRKGVPSELLKMDFERDLKDKLMFLSQVGVQGKDLGSFVTKNPHILLETVDELEARVGYLKTKKFTDDAISKIVNRAPYFLSFSVFRVDRKLGYLQQLLQLKGQEVREVITREPRLVTHKVSRIQESVFVLREQLGFRRSELKSLIVKEPKLLLRGKHRLISLFDYMHNVMDIPHKVMLAMPWVLHGRVHQLQERHQYLKSLGRDIYDPTQPQYVAVDALSRLPDDAFCEQIAKTSLEHYSAFLKSM